MEQIDNEKNVPRPEDIEAAMLLIKEHPLLRDDLLTKQVLERGIGGHGKPVNIDEFVETRGAFLELEQLKDRLQTIKNGNPNVYEAAVVHSVRPDTEKSWVN
ncbi:MAG: hypothetical protein A3A96_04240 [Candidatus Zambryskibacteria bacterium RIFCSPLOWO2_01_FULL_39_39]|uniref:Uncharacterized protein n=1 Tax=Candidatus Zambryskibacteria bacterium RIFCSPLOWO2_01_FULL_39_39 TaxID=1802758 RepID=A0A1G2TWX8_9BACT|nr:MAG: hypothetical protein UT00_C0003G0028 [Parcubacteria group bacterium GW2011_GWA1_38_7]OHA87338.1 MAG: hypothetical protein A2644_03865 [Candidatus Zambryskibacteria bacterium RIFCSPHIGHO2_01_FULL_39_63]OHA95313.1 MAG: hypothetical protein A3B88_02405 [Candidatus Zambryskibacteria bacterium RIFCSPHIGHO2_02_FULL_39_19]OHA98891.1 MAG: hypothetical protein A3F20_02500 [Candidatus Zambryskibacteria bacterium RIFCSPHIGHO2_12_FULL_39_21]OHB01744.1 MAG: hypothetical protein A3A96_04240 [Candidat